MRPVSSMLFVACTGILIAQAAYAENDAGPGRQESGVGRKIDNFTSRDFLGKEHSLNDYARAELIVVAFLGNDCPLAKLYAPRLRKLAEQYADRGVEFLGVNSNVQDTPTRIAAYVRRYVVPFPILKDAGNKVADLFGAERTPEVFLLDSQRVIRYRGRIDDQYGVGFQRPTVTHRELAEAIEELLAGKAVSTPVTEAVGCIIGRVSEVEPHGEITYTKHISRILNRRCVECHREGELAPFPLTSYDDVVGWGETMLEVVEDRRMPPWFADPRYGHFVNDSGMSEEEKELLALWVANGCPEGDSADLPEPPNFASGWRSGKPDAVYHMPAEYPVPAEETVDYQYFMVDPKFEEDVWVTGAEARPGNSEVVHHIVIYAVPPEAKLVVAALVTKQRLTGGPLIADNIGRRDSNRRVERRQDDEKQRQATAERNRRRRNAREQGIQPDRQRGNGDIGQMVAIYAPGMPPWTYPEGTAMRIRKGSVLVFQMHYTPNGTAQTDRSYVGFQLAEPDEVRKRVRYGLATNSRIVVPPYDPDYVATAAHTMAEDMLLLNLFPHMHYRGKAFRFEALYPDGSREILLDVPRYDFNWQLRYDLAEPKLLPQGTQLLCTARFDNSQQNPLNPDPSRTVRFGLQSWQEMLVGYYTVVSAAEDLSKQPLSTADSGDGDAGGE